jgi:hypothetical protein
MEEELLWLISKITPMIIQCMWCLGTASAAWKSLMMVLVGLENLMCPRIVFVLDVVALGHVWFLATICQAKIWQP